MLHIEATKPIKQFKCQVHTVSSFSCKDFQKFRIIYQLYCNFIFGKEASTSIIFIMHRSYLAIDAVRSSLNKKIHKRSYRNDDLLCSKFQVISFHLKETLVALSISQHKILVFNRNYELET